MYNTTWIYFFFSMKRQRASSLQECLETSSKPRGNYRQCFFILLIIPFVYHLYNSVLLDVLRPYVQLHTSRKVFLEAPLKMENVTTGAINESRHKSEPTSRHTNFTIYKSKFIWKTALEESVTARIKQTLPFCILNVTGFGRIIINNRRIETMLEIRYPMIQKGGYYAPPDCRSRHKVAILVPYRGRQSSLFTFLFNIHPFLLKQKLEYRIFVIEQVGEELFNKGRLYNAGFREMQRFGGWHCVVFHDVDLLPLDERILYTCPTWPRHMCASVLEKRHDPTYHALFGGVTAMTLEQYEKANGYSNLYWGWGGEDNDIFWSIALNSNADALSEESASSRVTRYVCVDPMNREFQLRKKEIYRLRSVGLAISRYNKSIAEYTMVPHLEGPKNPFRFLLLRTAMDRYKLEGLSDVHYKVLSVLSRPLFTHILVDVNPRKENITESVLQWVPNLHL